jgi:DDE superfamily endonuclease
MVKVSESAIRKNARWIRAKYFRVVGSNHWVFGTETGKTPGTGEPKLLTLYDIASTPIRRHRKIRAAANPFDPQWKSYFEERLGLAMMDSLKGRMRFVRLWLSQERTCPVCHQMITKSSGWRLFHLERVIDGGMDASRNLLMLHPDCHGIARGRQFSRPHRAQAVWQAFNARHDGRFHFHFTPLHASWVNQIKLWFGLYTRRVLRHASHTSTVHLRERTEQFIRKRNQTARAYAETLLSRALICVAIASRFIRGVA